MFAIGYLPIRPCGRAERLIGIFVDELYFTTIEDRQSSFSELTIIGKKFRDRGYYHVHIYHIRD